MISAIVTTFVLQVFCRFCFQNQCLLDLDFDSVLLYAESYFTTFVMLNPAVLFLLSDIFLCFFVGTME